MAHPLEIIVQKFLPVLCELDILGCPFGEFCIFSCFLQVCLYSIGITLACSDDCLQV